MHIQRRMHPDTFHPPPSHPRGASNHASMRRGIASSAVCSQACRRRHLRAGGWGPWFKWLVSGGLVSRPVPLGFRLGAMGSSNLLRVDSSCVLLELRLELECCLIGKEDVCACVHVYVYVYVMCTYVFSCVCYLPTNMTGPCISLLAKLHTSTGSRS